MKFTRKGEFCFKNNNITSACLSKGNRYPMPTSVEHFFPCTFPDLFRLFTLVVGFPTTSRDKSKNISKSTMEKSEHFAEQNGEDRATKRHAIVLGSTISGVSWL